MVMMSSVLMRLEASDFINNHLHEKDSKFQNNHAKIFFYCSFEFKIHLIFTKVYFHTPPADAAGHTDGILISKDT